MSFEIIYSKLIDKLYKMLHNIFNNKYYKKDILLRYLNKNNGLLDDNKIKLNYIKSEFENLNLPISSTDINNWIDTKMQIFINKICFIWNENDPLLYSFLLELEQIL